MHDPLFYMKLADHLFNVQMARYRSRYSLVTFPSDATYTPPALPAHVSVSLEAVSGAPSDDEIKRVQDAIQIYQELRRIPSMFDANVNMELSQHLFDLQMARHMRNAGEGHSGPVAQATVESEGPTKIIGHAPNITKEATDTTNNAGTGEFDAIPPQTSQKSLVIDARELMERSNQLAERFNRLLERSNGLSELARPPADQSSSQIIAEKLTQVLERLTQLFERDHQPVGRSDQLAELSKHSNQSLERPDQSAHKSDELADRANQLVEKLGRSSDRSNELSEKANKYWEQFGDVLKNISRVLVGIQHAIVRNRKGNTVSAINCLINDKGKLPGLMNPYARTTVGQLLHDFKDRPESHLPILMGGMAQHLSVPDVWLGSFLQFYGIGDDLLESGMNLRVKAGCEDKARNRLADYLSSCLG